MVDKQVDTDNMITGGLLVNYSFVSISSSIEKDVIALCATGLSPSDDKNGELGGWYFNGEQIPNKGCDNSVIQPNGANISNIVGAIYLHKCRSLNFSTSAEGVYACTIMNSSMMNQTMKLGVYFSGRGESIAT